MQDLSRWIWLSTKPDSTSRPPTSSLCASEAMRGAISLITPSRQAMSNVAPSRPAILALRRMKSLAMSVHRCGLAEISGLERGVLRQRLGLVIMNDLARFQHIAAIGDFQRQCRHLVDQQDGDALVAQIGQHRKQFADHGGRKPQ